MLDPEFKVHLEVLEKKLDAINDALKPSRWKMFVQGIYRAIGYLIGLVLIIAIFGWVLNRLGVVPFLKDISIQLKGILDSLHAR